MLTCKLGEDAYLGVSEQSVRPLKPSRNDDPSGRVVFDDRGNAIWETQSRRKLEHPGLELSDEEPLPHHGARPNIKGGRLGYDPYQSGMLQKDAKDLPKKKDLRALSQWIKMKKSLAEQS